MTSLSFKVLSANQGSPITFRGKKPSKPGALEPLFMVNGHEQFLPVLLEGPDPPPEIKKPEGAASRFKRVVRTTGLVKLIQSSLPSKLKNLSFSTAASSNSQVFPALSELSFSANPPDEGEFGPASPINYTIMDRLPSPEDEVFAPFRRRSTLKSHSLLPPPPNEPRSVFLRRGFSFDIPKQTVRPSGALSRIRRSSTQIFDIQINPVHFQSNLNNSIKKLLSLNLDHLEPIQFPKKCEAYLSRMKTSIIFETVYAAQKSLIDAQVDPSTAKKQIDTLLKSLQQN